MMPNK